MRLTSFSTSWYLVYAFILHVNVSCTTYVLISPFINQFVDTKKNQRHAHAHTARCVCTVWKQLTWLGVANREALISLPSRTSDCHAVSIMAK